MDLLSNPGMRRVLLTAGILETGNELVNFLLPIYGHSIGLSPSKIGLVIGSFAVALLFVRAIMPAMVKRSSEERVLCGSMLVAATAGSMLPFTTDFTTLAMVSFIMGIGLGCGAPLSLVLTYNRAPPGRSGEAIGLRQVVNKATEVVVPMVFGSMSTALGMLPVFWLNACMLGTGSWLMHREANVVRKAKQPDGKDVTRAA